MKIGMIGMGKMGLNLAQNFLRNGFEVAGFDVNPQTRAEAEALGVETAETVRQMIGRLPKPKIVWLMVPSGKIANQTVSDVGELLAAGDYVIDGGNSNYKDSVANYERLSEKAIHFYDCGTSGGVDGALNGVNFMIGGDADAFPYIEPIFQKIAQKDGYLFTGKPGSGHYLKMVHNGIEYGMMQAIAEGFDLLEHSPYRYDNEKVARLWNSGSVIRSWLMELMEQAFSKDPHLSHLKGVMFSSGEGRWTVEEAIERKVAIPVISMSLMMRYRSLEEDTFTGKVVASLRNEFGGHAVEQKG